MAKHVRLRGRGGGKVPVMDISMEKRSHRIVVNLSGRLDAEAAPQLEAALRPLLAMEEGASALALNLAEVDYISSAGIRSLLVLAKQARPAGNVCAPEVSRLRIVSLSPQVKRVLEISGLLAQLTGCAPEGASSPGPSGPEHQLGRLMEKVRHMFPAPVSDAEHDAFFVRTISHGLDSLDRLKTMRPYLGERVPLDYEAAQRAKMPETMARLEDTVDELAGYMEGLTIWGHPNTQENVIPPSSIPSIAGQLFGAIYNPNVIWDEYSHRMGQAEMEASAMCADMVGYDSAKAAGFFTFGGTGTVFYGVKLGVEKAQPGAFRDGVREDLKVVSSDAGHYAKLNALGWLGLGTKNLVTVPTDQDNSMDLEALEAALREIIGGGGKIAAIIATMGTTDAFGMDNLRFVAGLRDRLVEEYNLPYKPHVHADAVIGWAWSVFNDYDFRGNPMGFAPGTLRSLWDAHQGISALHLADSVGVDFHKTGYTPYVSSLVLVKDRQDLNLISRDIAQMPYMFQFGAYHPGVFTLEASRSGGAVLAALGNLKALGKEGYRALLGHIVEVAEYLRRRLDQADFAVVANNYNYGPVTLFRVYPPGVDAKAAYLSEVRDTAAAAALAEHNDYNRRIFSALHHEMEQGAGVALSQTDRYRLSKYGQPILALKSFVMSPFAETGAMDQLVESLVRAREQA